MGKYAIQSTNSSIALKGWLERFRMAIETRVDDRSGVPVDFQHAIEGLAVDELTGLRAHFYIWAIAAYSVAIGRDFGTKNFDRSKFCNFGNT